MNVVQAPQGSAAWLQARVGMITASRIKDVMSTLKNGGETAARSGYKWELITERLSGFTTEHYVSPDMDRGNEMEPIARAEYEIETGYMVDQVGLVKHPAIEFSAASPDGLIDKDGAIEVKAPRSYRQLQWILTGGVPAEHILQCQWVMECCEREWIDFCAFNSSLPNGLRLYVTRLHRDEKRLAEIRAEVAKLNDEVEAVVAELRGKVQPLPPKPQDMPAPPVSEWHKHFGEELPL